MTKRLVLFYLFLIPALLLHIPAECRFRNAETETLKPDVRQIREKFPVLDNLSLKAEIQNFIPSGYTVLSIDSGDLNMDSLTDFLLVLRKNGEDTISNENDHPVTRPLLLLIMDEDKKLRLAARNDKTVFCYECGGMMGDPFSGVSIENGSFSIEHYGGSAWRWTRTITYRYSTEFKEWFLYQDNSESFHVSEPDKIKIDVRASKEFGKVKFQEFDIYKDE
jgi:hypothetical protein